MRSPDPLAECRPGGSCPECNAPTYWCAGCGNVEVEEFEGLCDECQAEAEDDEDGDRRLNEEREGTV